MGTDRKRRIKVRNRPGIYYREVRGERHYEISFLDSEGRRRWKMVPGRLDNAESALEEVKGKLRRGERVAPARLTFAEAVELWRPTLAGLRPRTREAYESSLRCHLLPHFQRMRLAEITQDHVAAFIDGMRQRGYAGWSIRAQLVVLGRVFAYAVRRGIVATNPVRGLERGERPAVGRGEMRVLSREEIAAVLDAAEPSRRVLLATAVFTGLRLSELLGLMWGDVDFEGGKIRVRKQLGRDGVRVLPKTPQAVRDVVLMPALARMLREHRLSSAFSGDGDYVFPSGEGRGLDQQVVRRALGRAMRAAGLDTEDKPKLRVHDLRHTFASLLIAQGANVVFVSRQLGHASPDITLSVYSHLFDAAEHAERASAALEAGFGEMLGKSVETSGRNGQLPAATAEAPEVAFLRQAASAGD